ncbi:MAG: hypothetical protein QOJ92_2847 [Frankiales bacterium]|nr:hypothetical protein [Frankiales bacterium]
MSIADGEGSTAFTFSLRNLGIFVRVVLAVLVAVIVASRKEGGAAIWLILVILVPLTFSRVTRRSTQLFGVCIEASVLAIGVLATSQPDSALLPYLAAPVLAGGMALGLIGATVPAGLAAVVIVLGGLGGVSTDRGAYLTASAQWVVLALVTGLTGAWANRLSIQQAVENGVDPAYAAAHRLLSQLRPVARELPVGLDPGTVGRTLLDNLGTCAPSDRGLVAARTTGSRLVVLAHSGGGRPDWDLSVEDGHTAFSDAWITQTPQQRDTRFDGRPGASLALPIVSGVRSSGLVGIERTEPFSASEVADAARAVSTAAMQLEAALLFDEVRELATSEERRRLAREIHDGVAQELSYVGYVLDGLASQAKRSENELESPIRELRGEVTRLVSELRLSMFELKSDVSTHDTLGAALSEHVQSVAKAAGVTVHLSLRESVTRLPAETEAELLRIAQEAVGDVRRNVGAQNLWVELEVEPPLARLKVEHDGAERPTRRRDDLPGHAAVEERVARLRAKLEVSERVGGGSCLQVTVGAG